MSRAQKLIDHLVRRPGANLSACVRAVGLNPNEADDRKKVAAQLQQLRKAGKVKRTGPRLQPLYSATADAHKDFRVVKRDPTVTPEPDVYDPKPAPKPRETPPPKPPANSPLRESIVRLFTPPRKAPGQLTSDDVAAHIAEFVRKGGVIQVLGPGECSQPLRASLPMQDLHDESWRRRRAAQATKPAAKRRTDSLDEQEADDEDVAA